MTEISGGCKPSTGVILLGAFSKPRLQEGEDGFSPAARGSKVCCPCFLFIVYNRTAVIGETPTGSLSCHYEKNVGAAGFRYQYVVDEVPGQFYRRKLSEENVGQSEGP